MSKFDGKSVEELVGAIKDVYDVSVALIKKAGYWKYYKALSFDYDTATVAFEVAHVIACNQENEYPAGLVLDCVRRLWDEEGMEMAGMDEDEWDENGEDPLWERDDWKWNEKTEEWEVVE